MRLILIGLSALFVVSVVYLGYRHYEGLIETNAQLRESNVALEAAIAEQRWATETALEAVDEWQQAFDRLQSTLEQYRQVQLQANSEVRRLNELFAEHDLGALARARPGLIERRINSGTDASRRMLECATGHPDCPD